MTSGEQKWDHLLRSGFADGFRDKPIDWLFGYLPAFAAVGVNLDRPAENANLRILDVGCGKGAMTRALKLDWQAGFVAGVDTSSWAIDHAAAHSEGVCFRTISPTHSLPFASDSFDACIIAFVLCTMSSPDEQQRLLREILRVLAPGGRIAVVANNPEATNRRFSSVLTAAPRRPLQPGHSVKVKLFRLGQSKPFLAFNDYWWPDVHYSGVLGSTGFGDLSVTKPEWNTSVFGPFLQRHGFELEHFEAEQQFPPIAIYSGRKL